MKPTTPWIALTIAGLIWTASAVALADDELPGDVWEPIPTASRDCNRDIISMKRPGCAGYGEDVHMWWENERVWMSVIVGDRRYVYRIDPVVVVPVPPPRPAAVEIPDVPLVPIR